MKTGILALLVLIVVAVSGCDKIPFVSDWLGMKSKMVFCEKYNPSQDVCENQGQSFKTGKLTVLIDLYSGIGVDDVNLNITDVNSNKVTNTYEFSVSNVLKKIYFENIQFDYPSHYRVSVLKPDGTVIVSNEVIITN